MITNTTKNPHILDGLPGMIEASEARGQRQLVESTLLPSNMGGKRALFERMGFKFGKVVKDDRLFIHAELPTGWKKRLTDHSMWSEIVDEKGVKRVGIFYKAAFYDRDAFMNLVGRYKVEGDYGEGLERPNPRSRRSSTRKRTRSFSRLSENPRSTIAGTKSRQFLLRRIFATHGAKRICRRTISKPGSSIESASSRT